MALTFESSPCMPSGRAGTAMRGGTQVEITGGPAASVAWEPSLPAGPPACLLLSGLRHLDACYPDARYNTEETMQ